LTEQKALDNNPPISISADHDLPMGEWSSEQIRSAVSDNVMLTWAPGKARHNTPIITRGEGVHVYDDHGNKYLDWTSQAVCSNLGYSLPPEVIAATAKQMTELPFVYGGLGIVEVRARLSKLISEIMPGDLQGMVFPSSGSEANEAAIMMARRYTGKYKVINWYRSYHGGTTNSQQATGDFRRWYGGDRVPGFVKAFNPYPLFFDFGGDTEEERTQMALNMLEEQVLNEGPDTIALIQFESVVGGGGVVIPPEGYMQGVRAICDKYDILMHCDEVMVGFGRTGKLFGFQNYKGVIPDIVTAAKGLTSAALPLSLCATRKHIMDAFEEMPLGWGSTYASHPVAMACAYENVKYLLKNDVIGHVNRLEPVFENSMKTIAENHPCIKQYRSIGMFGCFDVHFPDGSNPQLQHTAIDKAFVEYKKAYTANGLIGLLRPPHLHIAPPLVISEEELLDGFSRQDKALYVLDEALGF
jgi:adenosylmethionine-8-amino-7-oxononanoate aminotransferase